MNKLPELTAEEWGKQLFEFELCSECGKDLEDHDIIKVMDNWFARCKNICPECDCQLKYCETCKAFHHVDSFKEEHREFQEGIKELE